MAIKLPPIPQEEIGETFLWRTWLYQIGQAVVTLQGKLYGSFLCTTSPTIAAANTAYTIPFNTTVASSGVAVGTPTSRLTFTNSGQYEVAISAQATKSSAAQGYVWIWVRKNGVDIPNGATRTTLQGSLAEAVVSRSVLVSVNANDYIEICYAADNTATSLLSRTATAFAPADPAVTVTISQVNQ